MWSIFNYHFYIFFVFSSTPVFGTCNVLGPLNLYEDFQILYFSVVFNMKMNIFRVSNGTSFAGLTANILNVCISLGFNMLNGKFHNKS